MAVRRGGGAFAALALAGIAYFFKNRKQVTSKVQELTSRAQNQLSGNTNSAPSNSTLSNTTPSSTEPRAYTGETTRI